MIMNVHAAIFSALLLVVGCLRADQLEMQNGDRYAGKVISMTTDTIVLQSDVLGKLTLPRSKVASLNIGTNSTASIVPRPSVQLTNQTRAPSIIMTNASPDIATALRNLGANTNFVEQVRKQLLSGAGPEANNKYDELVAGLFSGKFDMNSLRAEAKTAADQIRTLKRQGGDMGDQLDTYLAILDNFLKQTAPSATPSISPPASTTNSSPGITIVR